MVIKNLAGCSAVGVIIIPHVNGANQWVWCSVTPPPCVILERALVRTVNFAWVDKLHDSVLHMVGNQQPVHTYIYMYVCAIVICLHTQCESPTREKSMVTAFGQGIISLIPGLFRVGAGNGAMALLGGLCSTCK